MGNVDLTALPGCNPIQNGPGPATMIKNCAAPSVTGDPGTGGPAPTGPDPTTVVPPPASTYVPPPTTYVPPPTTVYEPPPSPTTIAGPAQTHYGQCGGYAESCIILFSLLTYLISVMVTPAQPPARRRTLASTPTLTTLRSVFFACYRCFLLNRNCNSSVSNLSNPAWACRLLSGLDLSWVLSRPSHFYSSHLRTCNRKYA